MSQEFFDLLIEYRWPVVAFGLGVVLLAMFRRPISGAIDRFRRFKQGGVELEMSIPEQVAEQSRKGQQDDLAFHAFDSPMLLETEELVRNDPRLMAEQDLEKRERILIRHLAVANIRHFFEFTYRLIFGTQITALRFLNAQPNGSDKATFEKFYRNGAAAYPNDYRDILFENWLKFMVIQNLLKVEGDHIEITVAGREFLKFLIEQGYPDLKQG